MKSLKSKFSFFEEKSAPEFICLSMLLERGNLNNIHLRVQSPSRMEDLLGIQTIFIHSQNP